MVLELVRTIAYLRVLQIAVRQSKAMAKSTEDSMKVNPRQKEHLHNAVFLADDPDIEPGDAQCCGKRRNSDTQVSVGEHREEIVHGLVKAGV